MTHPSIHGLFYRRRRGGKSYLSIRECRWTQAIEPIGRSANVKEAKKAVREAASGRMSNLLIGSRTMLLGHGRVESKVRFLPHTSAGGEIFTTLAAIH
jgi:hypothetical protein